MSGPDAVQELISFFILQSFFLVTLGEALQGPFSSHLLCFHFIPRSIPKPDDMGYTMTTTPPAQS